MKKYLLTQLIFIGLFGQFSEAMDTEQESQKQFSLCKQVLTIDPDAPAADYKTLAQRLHDERLSICECATYLSHEKRQKALRALKKEGFLSKKSIKRINEFQDSSKKVKKPLNKLVVTISEYLPDEIKDDIKKEVIDHFSPRFSPIKFKTNEFYNFHLTGAGTFCYLPNEFRHLKKPLDHLQFKHSRLIIGFDILDRSFYARRFTYLHEEQHLKDRHSIIKNILNRELEKMLVKKNGPDSELYKHKLNDLGKLHDKFSRALETEADLIPTACGSCLDSYSAVEMFDTLPKDDLKHHGTHPSILTRYKRARRIYHLKLAEEELMQKEERRIAYDLGLI